ATRSPSPTPRPASTVASLLDRAGRVDVDRGIGLVLVAEVPEADRADAEEAVQSCPGTRSCSTRAPAPMRCSPGTVRWTRWASRSTDRGPVADRTDRTRSRRLAAEPARRATVGAGTAGVGGVEGWAGETGRGNGARSRCDDDGGRGGRAAGRPADRHAG